MGSSLLELSGIMRGVVLSLLLFVAPVVGIRRTYELNAYNFYEFVFLAGTVLTGAISGYFLSQAAMGKEDKLKPKLARLSARLTGFFKENGFTIISCLFVAFYTSAAALSVRLGVFLSPLRGAAFDPFAILGLLIFGAGAASMIHAFSLAARIAGFERAYHAGRPGKSDQARLDEDETFGQEPPAYAGCAFVIKGQGLAHPLFFSWLLILTSVPLIMGTWLPLAALPGIFVAMKWKVQSRQNENNKVELEVRKDTKVWQIIPYVF